MARNVPMPPASDPHRAVQAQLTDPPPSGRKRRLLFVAVLIAALAPGLWWRSPVGWLPDNHARTLRATILTARTPASWPPGLRLAGAWHLTSSNNRFGGHSALLATDGGTLSAMSDLGRSLRFERPDIGRPLDPQVGRIGLPEAGGHFPDIEAATWDPRRGVRWFSAGERAGLLFASDPVSGIAPLEFKFRPPIGYSPSDIAALPDGRVAILLRSLDLPFPPFFESMLLVADPSDIAAGKEWRWRKLADLTDPVPRENHEGLAIVPEGNGVAMWLISDDNLAIFHRTLLLKLHWKVPPREAGAP